MIRLLTARRLAFTCCAASAILSVNHAHAGTLPLGNGADGALVVSGTTHIDTVRSAVVNDIAAGAGAFDVGSTSGFAVGDEVLIINQQGTTGAGAYEFARIGGISGNTVTLSSNLTNAYAGSSERVTLQRVPNFTSVVVQNGGSLTASAWDGTSGGIVAFRATAAVLVQDGGSISADFLGYRGGAAAPSNSSATGRQGESYAGTGAQGVRTANRGGGGGGLWDELSGDNGHGGGGGGHATGGTNGKNIDGYFGLGGDAYGSTSLTDQMFFGSGGGSGGTDDDNPNNTAPFPMAAGGAGGIGGGIVFIEADSFSITGTGRITARGQDGFKGVGDNGTTGNNGDETGGGGGGAGGSIHLGYVSAGPTLLPSDVVAGGIGGSGLMSDTLAGGSGSVGYVTVTTLTVPEPASIAGITIVGLLLGARRRVRQP